MSWCTGGTFAELGEGRKDMKEKGEAYGEEFVISFSTTARRHRPTSLIARKTFQTWHELVSRGQTGISAIPADNLNDGDDHHVKHNFAVRVIVFVAKEG